MTKRTSNTSDALTQATKVKGTVVYDLSGEKIGSVDYVMIDTNSGCAIYAVMAFGDSGGKGKKYHSTLSLPWVNMKYDARKGGYMVNLDKKVLEDAPDHDRTDEFQWTSEYGAAGLPAAARHQHTRIRLT
jgi:sporulation protein YlmC with PRC-barrel domain